MKKLSTLTRVSLGLAALSMIATYYLPLWQIQLWAPQYPEGLNMKIWHNNLSGSFDIINGLNHYIGMREIKAEMFPEFQYIGILLGIFIALGLLAAIIGTSRWLAVFVSTAFIYGAAALYDFYRWGYDYGHNLNPHAAIVVPGMSYQPPVLGYKNLLNFTAYSGPDQGGWIIIVVGIIASLLLAYEWYFRKANLKSTKTGVNMAAMASLMLLQSSCGSGGPEPIHYGQDACHHCKMTLTDKRFGAEIITDKGKVFKFDDLNCVVSVVQKGVIPAGIVSQTYAVDFSHPGQFIEVKQGFFLKNEALKSPMRGDVAAFSNAADRNVVKGQVGGGEELTWEATQASF